MTGHVFVQGMPVYDGAGTYLGAVQHYDDRQLTVDGRAFPLERVMRVTAQGVVVGPASDAMESPDPAPTTELRVPLARESARVDVAEVETGDALVHREVVVEKRMIPIDVMRDEVRVTRREIPVRALTALEAATAFNVRSIRIPLHAEEVRIDREPVVTGEVVIHRDDRVERRELDVRLREEIVEVTAEPTRAGAEHPSAPAAPAAGPATS